MMFSYVVDREFGWRKNTCCSSIKPSLQSLLNDFVCSTDDIYGHYDEGLNVPPLACCFSKSYNSSHVLAASDENGFITIFDTNLTKNSVINHWKAHENAIFDLTWIGNSENILTASGDQTLALWNAPLKEKIQRFRGHTKSVKSIAVRSDLPDIFCSGSRDGQILIYDMRVNSKGGYTEKVSAIPNAHSNLAPNNSQRKTKNRLSLTRTKSRRNSLFSLERNKSVTSVLFRTGNLIVSAGAINDHIKVWDLRMCSSSQWNPTPVHEFFSPFDINHGITSLVFDSTSTNLFASCKNNKIYQYDFASYSSHPVKVFHGCENESFYIKSSLSPCDQFLISGSHNNVAYIWDAKTPNQSYPIIQLTGHTAEVTTVSWSPYEFGKIVTLSDDNTLRLWRLQRNKKENEKNLKYGTACKYILPRNMFSTLSPNISCLTTENPVTPNSQKSTQQPSPPLSLIGWLKDNASRNGSTYGQTDCTPPIDESPDTSSISESSQLKLRNSVGGKIKVLAKRNLENAYGEFLPCSSSSKRCHVLQSQNQRDDNLAFQLENGENEDVRFHSTLDCGTKAEIENISQAKKLSPCQSKTQPNKLSDIEQTCISPRVDQTIQKSILHSIISLSTILTTPPTRKSLHSKSTPKSSQKQRPKLPKTPKTPQTPVSLRKTPHKSSPMVMSGKQSILSYFKNTDESPSN